MARPFLYVLTMVDDVPRVTTARQVGIVLCRVAAAILVVRAIRDLGYLMPGMVLGSSNWDAELMRAVLFGAIPGFVAIALWFLADRISTLPGDVGSARDDSTLSGVDLVRIGTTLIGVYMVVTAVIDAAGFEVTNLARPDLPAGDWRVREDHSAHNMGRRAAYLVQTALGILLIAGRDGIAAFLSKARRAGVDKS